MVSQLTVGVNSLATLAEADAYLADSLRAGNWLSVAPDAKTQAMISAFRLFEKQAWQGAASAVKVVATVVIAAGGTGYAVNDELTMAGGTFGHAARIQVVTVSSGVITAIALIDSGTYDSTDLATTPNTPTGGGGSGASITLTFGDQSALHPRTGLTDCDGQAVDPLVIAQPIKNAQIELAFDLTQDSTLETQKDTAKNIKKVGAGSAEVEFFRPTSGSRFPVEVHELIKCFLGSSTPSNIGSVSSGTDHCSQFDDDDRYELQDGASFP